MENNLTIWTPNEIQFSELDGRRVVNGYFAVYHRPDDPSTSYRPEKNVEMRINPGALDQALTSGNNVYALYSHDWAQPLGDFTSQTLKISSDAKGYKFSLTLPKTTLGNDVWTLTQDRILRGMSFTAARLPGGDKWTKEGSTDVLTFYRFGSLDEVTLTANPAFKGTSLFAAEAQTYSAGQRRKEIAEQLAAKFLN